MNDWCLKPHWGWVCPPTMCALIRDHRSAGSSIFNVTAQPQDAHPSNGESNLKRLAITFVKTVKLKMVSNGEEDGASTSPTVLIISDLLLSFEKQARSRVEQILSLRCRFALNQFATSDCQNRKPIQTRRRNWACLSHWGHWCRLRAGN